MYLIKTIRHIDKNYNKKSAFTFPKALNRLAENKTTEKTDISHCIRKEVSLSETSFLNSLM